MRVQLALLPREASPSIELDADLTCHPTIVGLGWWHLMNDVDNRQGPNYVQRRKGALLEDETELSLVEMEEDARYPIYQAIIEREWRQWRPRYVKLLMAEGSLKQTVDQMALMCVHTLQQCEKCELGPDQGRELVNQMIIPQDDQRDD